jgi:hypothetical protein
MTNRLDEETAVLAQRLAEKSTAIMRLGRDTYYRQQDMEFRAPLEYLRSLLALVTLTEDSAEGRKAFSRNASRHVQGADHGRHQKVTGVTALRSSAGVGSGLRHPCGIPESYVRESPVANSII